MLAYLGRNALLTVCAVLYVLYLPAKNTEVSNKRTHARTSVGRHCCVD